MRTCGRLGRSGAVLPFPSPAPTVHRALEHLPILRRAGQHGETVKVCWGGTQGWECATSLLHPSAPSLTPIRAFAAARVQNRAPTGESKAQARRREGGGGYARRVQRGKRGDALGGPVWVANRRDGGRAGGKSRERGRGKPRGRRPASAHPLRARLSQSRFGGTSMTAAECSMPAARDLAFQRGSGEGPTSMTGPSEYACRPRTCAGAQ